MAAIRSRGDADGRPAGVAAHARYDAQVLIHRRQDAADFCDMAVDQFDEMIEPCERHPLVMNVSVHTYVFGHPYRVRRCRGWSPVSFRKGL